MIYIKTKPFAKAVAFIAIAVAAALPQAMAQEGPQPKLQTTKITAGIHVITAEVAATDLQRQTGMMWRSQMGANEGMLFVFDVPQKHCFWMRNTLLPLTIAFVADDGTIVNTADMQARDESSHCAKQPVRYALEMNQGWFAKRGVKAGQKMAGAPFKP